MSNRLLKPAEEPCRAEHTLGEIPGVPDSRAPLQAHITILKTPVGGALVAGAPGAVTGAFYTRQLGELEGRVPPDEAPQRIQPYRAVGPGGLLGVEPLLKRRSRRHAALVARRSKMCGYVCHSYPTSYHTCLQMVWRTKQVMDFRPFLV